MCANRYLINVACRVQNDADTGLKFCPIVLQLAIGAVALAPTQAHSLTHHG